MTSKIYFSPALYDSPALPTTADSISIDLFPELATDSHHRKIQWH